MSDETILIVDDEPANLQKLRRTLINRYPVLAAGSGTEALDLVRSRNDIAVIIADQRMPDMSGVELLRYSLDLLPQAIRIILTGYTDVDTLIEAINYCRVFRYIVKPWDPPDLLLTVERALETRHLAVENAQFRKELIRRERMAQELEIAGRIQRYILPSQCPAPEGYEIAVEYHPAREVGGDLYDFSWDPLTGALQLVVADVSGKSIPAALYGAVFGGQVQALLAQSPAPADALSSLNANLIRRYQVENYVAVAFLRLDLNRGNGSFANAGMPYPYLLRGGVVSRICNAGVPLGLLEEAAYEETAVSLDIGDTLLFSSDGTTEALNPSGELFEEARFTEAILAHSCKETSAFVNGLYLAVAEFMGVADSNDDITLVAIRRCK
jgi:sigma-B regulation protein RsbU (phosphoserine phosphatase)